MAENEASHRHKLEEKYFSSSKVTERIGLCFGLAAVFIIFSAVVLCAQFKQSIPASILGGTGVIGIVTAFIHGSKKKSEE